MFYFTDSDGEMIAFEELEVLAKCRICSAPINRDGTVSYCGGECGREIEHDQIGLLNFNES
jgi:hypothetical protein